MEISLQISGDPLFGEKFVQRLSEIVREAIVSGDDKRMVAEVFSNVAAIRQAQAELADPWAYIDGTG